MNQLINGVGIHYLCITLYVIFITYHNIKLFWLLRNHSHQLALLFLPIGLHELEPESVLGLARNFVHYYLFVIHVIHYNTVVELKCLVWLGLIGFFEEMNQV